MCGIAGYFGEPDRSLEKQTLVARMVGAIAHRGPDASGVFIGDHVGLGHARLSIIDIAGGQQPMASNDGSVHITFGGEIFNYVELRRDLAARGHQFRTASDTEVILHAYEYAGTDCLAMFNGDFAFALWDSRQRLFMLARDRMGVRPLYFTRNRGCLYFASEVKALLQVPGIEADIDPVALFQAFTLAFTLPPRTMFKGISTLAPGQRLVETPQSSRVDVWWHPTYPDAADASAYDNREESVVAENLRALLFDATTIRLRSDVPVGVYLSGGLDSSAIAATVNKLRSEAPRTFSLSFEAAEFDESQWQRAMVEALGSEHSAVAVGQDDIARLFPTVVRHVEQSLVTTAPTPMMALASHVREQGYKVVLTGEGADELFAGYDVFREVALQRFCARQPASRWRAELFRRLYPHLSDRTRRVQQYRRKLSGTSGDQNADPLAARAGWYDWDGRSRSLFSVDLRAELDGYDALAELRDCLPADLARWDYLNQAQYIDTVYRLPGYLLSAQGDRMAMANAVEARFPFLDHRIVAFASRLPPRLKLRGLRTKRILRLAMENLLPRGIARRVKQPYRAPGSRSFGADHTSAYVAERLAPDAINRTGCFDPKAIERLLARNRVHPNERFRDSRAYVAVLSTQIWHAQFRDAGGASRA